MHVKPSGGCLAGMLGLLAFSIATSGADLDIKKSEAFQRIKAHLNATPAIDTHDHIPPFDLIRGREETTHGFRDVAPFALAERLLPR